MNKALADQYAEYDNALNNYFDQVELDLVTDAFREEYYNLRNQILQEIFEDNRCYPEEGSDELIYTKNPNYDEVTIRLLQHYHTVSQPDHPLQAVYEVQLLLIEHYMELCGYHQDDLGYWFKNMN